VAETICATDFHASSWSFRYRDPLRPTRLIAIIADDAISAILDAAKVVGVKHLQPQVLEAIRSTNYKNTLEKIAAKVPIRADATFEKGDVLPLLGPKGGEELPQLSVAHGGASTSTSTTRSLRIAFETALALEHAVLHSPGMSSGKKPLRLLKDVSVKVDEDLKKAWDRLSEEIKQHHRAGASAFDALWEAVAKIVEHDPPLYVVGGYKNAAEYFEQVLGEKERNAYRFIRVAKFASPRDEQRWGTTKLDAALSFVEAKLGAPLVDPPLPVALDRIRIPASDSKTHSLDEATVEEIEAATRALSGGKRKAPRSEAEAALQRAVAAVDSLARVRVHVRSGLITFTGVPVAAIGRFAGAIARAKVTQAAPKKPAPPKKRR